MRAAAFSLCLCLLMTTALATAHASGQCPIPGNALHWVIDYCAATLETDFADSPAVLTCVEAENGFSLDDEDCAAKRLFKLKFCGLSVSREGYSGTVEECLNDREFVGHVVANGGVGG